MPKYTVKLQQTNHYLVEVEADNSDKAIDEAWEFIETEDGKDNYHNYSDGKASATKIH